MPQSLFLDATMSASAGFVWALGLPVVLGFVAIYLLLPRPRGYPPWWGAILAALALVSAGFLVVQSGGAVVETVLFYCFAAVAVVAGGLLVTQRNPVKAALSFALVVLSTCGLFLLQAAPFLMAATIIIYAGAIIVTFLFVIMLARQTGLSDADARSREPLLSCVAGFVLLGGILLVLHSTYNTWGLDDLLAIAQRAGRQPSAEAVQRILGDKKEFLERFHREADRAAASSVAARKLHAALNDLETEWNRGDVDKMKQALVQLDHAGQEVRREARNHLGNLQPPSRLPLSAYSQQAERNPNPEQQSPLALPRENVAYLGRSLFTDYLLAVELGGTLLLVATIGAIAIAARRAEGLR